MKFGIIIALVLCAIAMPTQAAIFKVTPVGPETLKIRYLRGEPTIYSVRDNGVILVVSHGLNDDKRLVLDVLAFNKGGAPQNFGTENIGVTGKNGQAITVFGFEELTRQAENKATWAKIWLGLAGVAGAVAANESGYSTTHGSFSSRYGTSTFYAETYNPAVASANVAAVADATEYGFATVQANLDNTRAQLNNSTLRTTTIDPGRSFGGQVVTDAIKGAYPQTVVLKIIWAGEEHLIELAVTKGNQAAPPIPAAATFEATAMPESSDAAGWSPAPQQGSATPGDYASPPQNYGPPPSQSDIRPGRTIPYLEGN